MMEINMRVLCFFLSFCAIRTEGFSVRGPAMPLVVQLGASVTLPCSVDTPVPLQELEVQWMREDSGSLVHLFLEGEPRPESQSPAYIGRAQYFTEEISRGNFSLLLRNVTTEDKGLYKCVVHTEHASNETQLKVDIDRLVVTGADVAVSAYAGEDVILNCSVDTHVPLSELQVEWIKTNGEILVLLFDEGENRPESQHERFSGRAEFFSEEIPKGNFSLKLRDVKTDDKGEYMCKVHTDRESVNATAWLKELGFSTLHIWILFLTITAAGFAVLSSIPALCFIVKKDKRAILLCRLQVSVPCILMCIAFAIWGKLESSVGEAYVCSAINLTRILVIFMVAPSRKLFPDTCYRFMYRFRFLAVPLQSFVIITGMNSVALYTFSKYHAAGAETGWKIWIGISFGLAVVCSFSAIVSSGLNRKLFLGCQIVVIIPEALFVLATHSFAFSVERPVWICVIVFLCILFAATAVPHQSHSPAVPHLLVYAFGSAALSVTNSVALTTEVFLKAEKGERTVTDLRLIVLPLESFFLACWLVLMLYAYCVSKKKKVPRSKAAVEMALSSVQHTDWIL